jgi:hypothetical protein
MFPFTHSYPHGSSTIFSSNLDTYTYYQLCLKASSVWIILNIDFAMLVLCRNMSEETGFRNVGNNLQYYTASQSRKPQSTSSPPWEPQISASVKVIAEKFLLLCYQFWSLKLAVTVLNSTICSTLLVIYWTFNTRIFYLKFSYLWRHVSVLIYHLQTIFQMFANKKYN